MEEVIENNTPFLSPEPSQQIPLFDQMDQTGGPVQKRGFLKRAKEFLVNVKGFVFVLPSILKRRRREIFPSFLRHGEVAADSFSKFIKQSVAAGTALLFVTSIAPAGLREAGASADYLGSEAGALIDSATLPQDYLMPESEDGYFLKMHPQEGDSERIGFTDKVKHTVESGETLSEIAARYGLRSETLVWENKLDAKDYLSVGQTLVIPPVDGFTYTVGASETVGKIAKKFEIAEDVIKTHNKLTSDAIQKGQALFLPGAKPPREVSRAMAREGGGRNQRSVVYNTFEAKGAVIGTSDKPSDGKPYIYPTTGSLSRGFGGGHYGLDIANRDKPDVWAAAAGTVVKSKGGCPERSEEKLLGCNGGYGNHVVIDHGDGKQTLYGHMETLYVTEGQQVEQGQLIGGMGSSGRVFGPTGIHVHWECITNGVKRNCKNYF